MYKVIMYDVIDDVNVKVVDLGSFKEAMNEFAYMCFISKLDNKVKMLDKHNRLVCEYCFLGLKG